MRRFVIQFGLFNEKKEKSEERIKHVRNEGCTLQEAFYSSGT
jgi:hypothetical protein